MAMDIILVGLPTSGKSTLVETLKTQYENIHVFSTDAEIERMAAEDIEMQGMCYLCFRFGRRYSYFDKVA